MVDDIPMASKTRENTSAKSKKGSARKKAAAKSSRPKPSTKVTKKATANRKTDAKQKASAKQKAGAKHKASAKHKATAGSKPKPARHKSADPQEESELTLDDLMDVDDLVDDTTDDTIEDTIDDPDDDPSTPGVTTAANRLRSPRTPSVPRSVKPPPKHADLEMSEDILEFVDAIDAYRQEHSRPFPTWTEVFHVLRELGYSKDR